MGVELQAIPDARRAERRQPRQVSSRCVRQSPAAAPESFSRPRQDHDPRGHRRRRQVRQAQDVHRRVEHRSVVRPRTRRRVRHESAIPAVLSRCGQGRCAGRRSRGIARRIWDRRPAFGRGQFALGTGRLDLCVAREHGDRADQALRQ